MVEIFVGQNFFLVFYLIGCDFCHLPNILSLLTDEVSTHLSGILRFAG